MKTFLPKLPDVQASRKWFLIDAQDKTLGSISTEAARRLQGKHKPTFTNHLDLGDGIIIINAEKIKLSGNKLELKKYYRHSGHPGHLKEMNAAKMLQVKPTKLLELAIKGMLPSNKHRNNRLARLKIFVGNDHSLQAQKPELITI